MSVVLSVAATLLVEHHNQRQADKTMDVLRARKIELMDAHGQVRGEFRMGVGANGEAVPMVLLRDKRGQEAVNLYLTPKGEGTLAFNSLLPGNFREGIVSVGHFELGDTEPAEESSGAWGISVMDSRHTSTSMGVQNTGKPLGLSAHR